MQNPKDAGHHRLQDPNCEVELRDNLQAASAATEDPPLRTRGCKKGHPNSCRF